MSAISRRRFLGIASVSALGFAPLRSAAFEAGSADPGDKKLAIAHYMAGKGPRSYRPTREEWVEEIRDALNFGIDGWQMNFAYFRDRYVRHVSQFVSALDSMGSEASGFCFFPSFDCNKGRKPERSEVREWYKKYYDHPNHLRVNGLPLFTAWQTRQVGDAYFVSLKKHLADQGMPVVFIPWIATRGGMPDLSYLFKNWESIDGFWPFTPAMTNEVGNSINRDVSQLCRHYGKELMAGQGYSFFTPNKNTWYKEKHAAESIPAQMGPLITGDVDCRILNVASWNDYGEDHHVAPRVPWGSFGGPHPVHGHIGYAAVMKFYLDWWKSGVMPVIENDSLVFFHRLQLVDDGNPPFATTSYKDKPTDTVYVTAILREPGQITVKSGDAASVRFEAPAGISFMRAPAGVGQQQFSLSRAGSSIIDYVSTKQISSPPSKPWSWSLHSEVVEADVNHRYTSEQVDEVQYRNSAGTEINSGSSAPTGVTQGNGNSSRSSNPQATDIGTGRSGSQGRQSGTENIND
jgi:hypothetical protein